MRLPDSPIAAVTEGRVVGVTLAANALAGRKLKRMKQKHEGKDLQGLEDLDIKVLEEVPTDGADDAEVEAKEEPEEAPEAAPPATDSLGESSDPVRLYLKEMGNFQLLSREQEVEI